MCTCRSPISLRRNSVLSFFAKYICRTADKCPEKSLVVNLSLQSDSADVITTDVRLTVRDKNYLHGQEFETTYMKSDSLFRESRTQRSNVWTFYVSIRSHGLAPRRRFAGQEIRLGDSIGLTRILSRRRKIQRRPVLCLTFGFCVCKPREILF